MIEDASPREPTGLDPEYLAELLAFRDDASKREAWRRFNEAREDLDLEDLRESDLTERLLELFGGRVEESADS